MKKRPLLISVLAWLIIVTSILGIITSFLPFVSDKFEKFFGSFLNQGKWISFLYSILRNAVAIFASVGLLKGLSWIRPIFIIYFIVVLFLNWILYDYFNWINLIVFIVFTIILFLPMTNEYLKIKDSSNENNVDFN